MFTQYFHPGNTRDVTAIAEGPLSITREYVSQLAINLSLKEYYQCGGRDSYIPYVWSRYQGDRRPTSQASGESDGVRSSDNVRG